MSRHTCRHASCTRPVTGWAINCPEHPIRAVVHVERKGDAERIGQAQEVQRGHYPHLTDIDFRDMADAQAANDWANRGGE